MPSYPQAVNADFDGDDKVDRAGIQFSEGRYEIEIVFRANPEVSSRLTWPSTELVGVDLVACDIDQDGDQDLILRSATSLFPLVIWIGDGKGHFEEGDPGSFILPFSKDSGPVIDPAKRINRQVCLPRQRQLREGIAESFHEVVELESSGVTFVQSHEPLPQRRGFFLIPRSPPNNSAVRDQSI